MVLNKYFRYDFTKSDHVVLFTNGVVKETLNVGNFIIQPKEALTLTENIFDTSEDRDIHIHQITNTDGDGKITFYTSQKNRYEIEQTVRRQFKEKFFIEDSRIDGIYQKYKSFFQMWKKGYHETCKLDKQDVKMKIAEILFYDSIINYNVAFTKIIDEKVLLLQRVLNNFDVGLIQGKIADSELKHLCCTDLAVDEILECGRKFLIHTNNINCFNKNIGIILWHLRQIPLIVKVDKDNKRMILELIKDLHKENLSFILIGDDVSSNKIEGLKVFKNLNDIDKNYEDIINKFRVSIQGQKEILLNDLINCNHHFKDYFTLRELILMLGKNFLIGEEKEILPEPYVPRRLLSKMLKIECIDQMPNDVFLVEGAMKVLKSKLRKRELCYYNTNLILNTLPLKTVIVSEGDTSNCFSSLKKHRFNVHWVTVIGSDHLQLIKSKETSEKLKRFRLVPEDQLYAKVIQNVNLICAPPGMGKLTLLNYLKNNCPPAYWTVKVDFQEYQTTSHIENSFVSQLKNCFEEAGRIIYFFYGIENLHDDKLVDAVKYIQQLSDRGFHVWVFAEDHLQETLEAMLGVCSITIEEFDEEEQKQYIQNRLKENKLDQNFEKVLANFKMLKNNDILGAPMHLFMLTEIFINNPKTNIEEVFILTDIYQYFIKTKYEHYLKKNNNFYHQNQFLDDGMYYRTEQYKLVAASCFFKNLNIQCDPHFLNQIKSKGDVLGIILKISDRGATFSQQTYADYFAALWLASNYQKIRNLHDFIFKEEFKNILFMFNLELSKNNPAHIAVLYQNYDQLEKYSKKLTQLDLVKRTPLHLVCSLGTKYPASKDDHSFKFKERIKENRIMDKIVNYLIINLDFDPLQCDELFGWNLFDYAFTMMNLYAAEKILTVHSDTDLGDSVILQKNIHSIIYFSVKFGYKNIVKLASQFPIFEELLQQEDSNGETLLHLAVKTGILDIVEILLDKGADINRSTQAFHKRSPLHIAVQNGHYEVVKFLTKKGASIDVMDRHRSTPLHLAASKADLRSARLLLELGADINSSDNFGRRPLHRAAASGRLKIIDFLIEKGADIDQKNRFGQTPIDFAYHNQKSNAFKLLLKKGAFNSLSMTIRRKSDNDFEGFDQLPLHWAAIIGQIEDVDRLLEEGHAINSVDSIGQTPLHFAVMKRQHQMSKMLIERGAGVNIANHKNVTPIFWAINNQDVKLINLLLENGGTFDIEDYHQRTPLHWSAVHCSEDIIKLVLSRNPELDVVDIFGRKPIDYAAESGNYEIINLLSKEKNLHLMNTAKLRSTFFESYENISYNLDASSLTLSPFLNAVDCGNIALIKKFLIQEYNIDENDDFGYTALHRAVVKEHDQVVRLLLDENAQLGTFDNKITLLHFAAFCGNTEIAKSLVKSGAEVNKLDDFGYNSLHISAMQGHTKTLSFLIQSNGDYNKHDQFGNTPLDWGCKGGHVKVVKMLKDRNAVAGTVQGCHLDMATVQNRFFEVLKNNYTRL